MKFLDTIVVLAALLTSVFAMSSPDAQKTGAQNIEAENVENSCRPRLCKSHFHYYYYQRRLIDSF